MSERAETSHPNAMHPPGSLPEPRHSHRLLAAAPHMWGLVHRLVLLGALLIPELIGISGWLDTQSLTRKTGLVGFIADRGSDGLLVLVAAVAAFLALAYASARSDLERISLEMRRAPIAFILLVAHGVALAVWIGLSQLLFGETLSGANAESLAIIWLVLGVVAGVLAALTFVPYRFWLAIISCTRRIGVYAAVVAIGSYLLKSSAEALWKPSSDLTFALVTASLRPLVPDLVVDPRVFKIGSRVFSVFIAKECSGLEGAGLMLVFGALWLWFLRREYRFPQALLLIPVGVVVMWLVNVVRIDILFLIGHAGLRSVAAGGFHSQAGWIAFNAVALGFSAASRRARWLTRETEQRSVIEGDENPVAPYLVPVLVIMAAGMVSRAASGGFEWPYPLRVIAAAAVLLYFRPRYKDLDWRAGWLAPVAGVLVFCMWLVLDRFAGPHSDNGIASGLGSLAAPARILWLAFRTFGAVVTVPIAEELAFRGYLLRRLVSSDFASVGFGRFSLVAVLVSSVVFGLLHGDRLVAGTIAGLIYAGTTMWRGRIGDAVAAHATTNLLIAASVLLGGMWQLW